MDEGAGGKSTDLAAFARWWGGGSHKGGVRGFGGKNDGDFVAKPVEILKPEKTQDDGATSAKPEFVQDALRSVFTKMQPGLAEVDHRPDIGRVFAFKDQHSGLNERDGAANRIHGLFPCDLCNPSKDTRKKRREKETDDYTFGWWNGERKNSPDTHHECAHPDETAT